MNPKSHRGCLMCDSLYVKANGEMPCWDDVGESHVLRKLDYADLLAGNERNLFWNPKLFDLRRSFMSGQTPYPGLCEFCAVRDHGPLVTSVKPDAMRILHIEPSYLCHLSCPQCIPAKDRRNLTGPPYNMPSSALDALLRQLQAEGLRQIGIVHFEGRGDPLMNPQLGKMIEITRRLYPGATTMVTTHGSYHYKPWIVESGLDILRVSIDGAFPQNYAKYRVGGDLTTVLKFLQCLRNERQRVHSSLAVNWKYILFEWNDSDEEIRHAAYLANALDVSLEFVLTHSPGRSKRFSNVRGLQEVLQLLAPAARVDTTFPLKEPTVHVPETELEQKIVGLLVLAKKQIQAHDELTAFGLIVRALEYDCGLRPDGEYKASRNLIRAYLPLLLTNGRYPATLAGLSEIFQEWGDRKSSILLLKKYVRTVTDMPRVERLWLALRLQLQLRSRCRAAIARLNLLGIRYKDEAQRCT